jgi:hypothetical protein
MSGDLAAVTDAAAIDLGDAAFLRLRNDPPPAAEVVPAFLRATPAGRVLLAMVLDPVRGRYALATLAADDTPVDHGGDRTTVAAFVAPLVAADPAYGAPRAPRPPAAEAVLAPRFAAALHALCALAGRDPAELTPAEPLPDAAATERIEAALRETALFAPGLLDLATRRAVEVTPEGGPAPGDLDGLCAHLQVVLDAATLADVAAFPGPRWDRGVVLARAVTVPDLPDAVEHTPTSDPKAPEPLFRCREHGHVVHVAGT